jgi:uncharacterized protein YggT (Ycf19 family)
MAFLISLIDIFLILVLARNLVRPNEAFFDPVYRLIYRITDPLLRVSSYVAKTVLGQVFFTMAALIVLRGILYGSNGVHSIPSGIGASLLDFFRLLFQAYFVLWFVTVLSKWSYQTSIQAMIDRAFHPFNKLSWRFRIRRKNYHLFVLAVLVVGYILVSGVVRYALTQGNPLSVFPYGLVEAFLLLLGLFPFPGFFSLVIIVGALLSWVNPDPSNSIVRAIYGISEPLLQPFRRFIPTLGGFDISPVIALICFQLIGNLGQQVVAGLIRG